MAIVTQGTTANPTPTPTGANQSNPISQLAPDLNALLAGTPVSAATLPSNTGPNGALTNQLLAGSAFDVAANNANNLALNQQGTEQQAEYALQGQEAQTQAGQSQQGLALQGQSQALQRLGLNQQAALDPKQQAIEAQQYGTSQESAAAGQAGEEGQYTLEQQAEAATLANTQRLYQESLPGQASGANSTGAGNSGAATLAAKQNLEGEQYSVGQQQSQQKEQQIGQTTEEKQYALGQKSAGLGQKGELQNYKYSQEQIKNQEKGLDIAAKQLGLSKEQVNTSLTQSLQAAGLGSAEAAAAIKEAITSGNASAINNLITQAGLGSVAATPAKPASKTKVTRIDKKPAAK